MENKWIESFLSIPEMNQLYRSYLIEPTNEKKLVIEEQFKIHVKKLKIISYFSKVLHFEAQRFDKKKRKNSDLNTLIIDNDEFQVDKLFVTDESDSVLINSIAYTNQIEHLVEDKKLYKIIANLSDKNKELLYSLFVLEMDESLIAKNLGITKQAVNKNKNSILKKIREQYFG